MCLRVKMSVRKRQTVPVLSDKYVFTINNYTEEDVRRLGSMPREQGVVLFGKEVGLQGTPHLQGVWWCEDSRRRRGVVEKYLGGRAWLAPCRDLMDAVGYCMKDGDVVYSGGEIPNLERAFHFSRCYSWLGTCFFQPDILRQDLGSIDNIFQMHAACGCSFCYPKCKWRYDEGRQVWVRKH